MAFLNKYFYHEKDEIIGRIWERAFREGSVAGNEDVLLSSVQWFLIDVSYFSSLSNLTR